MKFSQYQTAENLEMSQLAQKSLWVNFLEKVGVQKKPDHFGRDQLRSLKIDAFEFLESLTSYLDYQDQEVIPNLEYQIEDNELNIQEEDADAEGLHVDYQKNQRKCDVEFTKKIQELIKKKGLWRLDR